MKISKIRRHITNARRVTVPFTVDGETHGIPVVKSAVKELLSAFDKDTEFPATLAVENGDLVLTLG